MHGRGHPNDSRDLPAVVRPQRAADNCDRAGARGDCITPRSRDREDDLANTGWPAPRLARRLFSREAVRSTAMPVAGSHPARLASMRRRQRYNAEPVLASDRPGHGDDRVGAVDDAAGRPSCAEHCRTGAAPAAARFPSSSESAERVVFAMPAILRRAEGLRITRMGRVRAGNLSKRTLARRSSLSIRRLLASSFRLRGLVLRAES